jgi:hypothetical protein
LALTRQSTSRYPKETLLGRTAATRITGKIRTIGRYLISTIYRAVRLSGRPVICALDGKERVGDNDCLVATEGTKTQIRSEWDSLVDVLDGIRPEQVDSLVAARQLEMVYPLLHALTRGSMADFFLRTAALEAFVSDGRSPLKAQEAIQVLYWVKEPDSVLRVLRESGWLEFEPVAGYRITETGHFVATVFVIPASSSQRTVARSNP